VIRRFLAWLGGVLGLGAVTYRMTVEPDVPDQIAPRRLYVVGDTGQYWLAAMKCPCGCGADIQLPLSGDDGPRWSVEGAADAPTLRPSVHRTTGCRSHFILRRGKVVWCR
jgi:hypothetical protein